jgi:protein ImuB
MFACVHVPAACDPAILDEIGHQFSPEVELNDNSTVVFSIEGLAKLMGSAQQIAGEIARQGSLRGIQANLAVAPNPDAAIQAARFFSGTTFIRPGQEVETLGEIPVTALPLPDDMRETLMGWGINTFAEFAALPPLGIVERFGAEGLRLQDQARGTARRPLLLKRGAVQFERSAEFDHPLDNSQSLLFVINGMLVDLCREMSLHGVAASQLRLQLDQERILSFAIPLRGPAPILKLLQLHLDANPPAKAVIAVTVTLIAVEPRIAQSGLFAPTAPEPARLQILLARIGGIVGTENVGAAELLNTHRPDAFIIKPISPGAPGQSKSGVPHLVIRLYRPALKARVIIERGYPRRVAAQGITGNVITWGGPWRGSGDWWTHAAWARDEWDVALSDGGIYRIFRMQHDWFVAGVYD